MNKSYKTMEMAIASTNTMPKVFQALGAVGIEKMPLEHKAIFLASLMSTCAVMLVQMGFEAEALNCAKGIYDGISDELAEKEKH
jgi:hypothetical protein